MKKSWLMGEKKSVFFFLGGMGGRGANCNGIHGHKRMINILNLFFNFHYEISSKITSWPSRQQKK